MLVLITHPIYKYLIQTPLSQIIIGIILFFTFGCGILLAIPSVILANGALTITNGQPGHPDSGSAKAAQVISWITIGLTILGIIVIIFIIIALGGFAAMG